LSPIISEENE